MYWNTADEIMISDPELAILPVGSIEQHGPHLPVMTDWAIGAEVGRRVQALTKGFYFRRCQSARVANKWGRRGASGWSRRRFTT